MSSSGCKVGRFAPSPTGRMHMGNIFSALMAWLSVRNAGGRFILRIENLDSQRSRTEYAALIEDDLHWLGLDWDEGGLADIGTNGPYSQCKRAQFYSRAIAELCSAGLVYPCRCTRAELHSVGAPHASDGQIVYQGTCRPASTPPFDKVVPDGTNLRIWTPDEKFCFIDKVQGRRCYNLKDECGDFVLRRADGTYAYQLAVVVDDAAMGVNEVVRGADLLGSSPRQMYLYRLLHYPCPTFAHVPLLCNEAGIRLSKRDHSMSMEHLRSKFSPEQLLGRLATIAGLIPEYQSTHLDELVPIFGWNKIKQVSTINIDHTTLLPSATVHI